MEITQKNFQEGHERIQNLLQKQDKIVSISFGAISSKGPDNGAYKSCEYPFDIFFKNFRFSKYGLIQTAVTLIEKVDESYLAHPFIFYLFPNDEQTQIILSSDLYEMDIDWNKWMVEGLPFKNREQIDKYRNQIFNVPRPDQKKDTYEEMFNKLNDGAKEQVKLQLEKFHTFVNDPNSEKEFTFGDAYSNIRKLYYTFLEDNHPELIISKSMNNNVIVKKCTPEEKKVYDDQNYQEKLSKIEEFKSVSKTFELIFQHCQQYKTPFVSFNSLYELSQIISYTVQFLPRSFVEFKQLLLATIPTIVDVKYTLYSINNKRNTDPASFIASIDNQAQVNLMNSLTLAEGVTDVNSLSQKTIDLSKIWLIQQGQLNTHVNKLFVEKSNWIICLHPDQNDICLVPENRVILTILPGENNKTNYQKKQSIQKTFYELTKFHRKAGVFFQKSEQTNMIVLTIDATKINAEGYIHDLKKLKDAKYDDYENLYTSLLNAHEDYCKQEKS